MEFSVAFLIGKTCSRHSQSVESLGFVTKQFLVGVMVARVSIKEAMLAQVTVYYLNLLTLTGKLGVVGFKNTCLYCLV